MSSLAKGTTVKLKQAFERRDPLRPFRWGQLALTIMLVLAGAFCLMKYLGWAWVVSGAYGLPSQAGNVAVARQWSLAYFWAGLLTEGAPNNESDDQSPIRQYRVDRCAQSSSPCSLGAPDSSYRDSGYGVSSELAWESAALIRRSDPTASHPSGRLAWVSGLRPMHRAGGPVIKLPRTAVPHSSTVLSWMSGRPRTPTGTPTVSMPTSTTVSYTTASNQVSGWSMNNGLALGYDAAGNVTSDGINLHDDRLGTAEFRLSFANRVGQFRLEHLTCRRSWADKRRSQA